MHEAPALQRRLPPRPVAQAHRALQYPLLQVQLLAVGQDLDRQQVEPVAALRPEGDRQPVRQVDEVLVLDNPPGDLGGEAIIAAGEVGPGIMRIVGLGFLGGAAGGEIAVAERAKRLAQTLLGRLEAVVGKRPIGHRARSPSIAARSPRKRPTCTVSAKAYAAAVGRAASVTRTPMPRPRSAAKASSSVSSSPR